MLTTYSSIQQYAQLVELKDYRPATKKEYVRMVRRLGDHVQCDPAILNENRIRELKSGRPLFPRLGTTNQRPYQGCADISAQNAAKAISPRSIVPILSHRNHRACLTLSTCGIRIPVTAGLPCQPSGA